MKMLSFRLDENLHTDFKDFCVQENTTIKDTLTNVIKLLLEAKQREKNLKKLFPNPNTTATGD